MLLATVLGLLLLIGIYFLSAALLSRIPVNEDAKSAGDISIYIRTNGVHTDIVVPVRTAQVDWSKLIPYKNTKAQDSSLQWLALGWGDKGFYLQTPTWADLRFSVAFNAMFGLGESAMHTTYYAEQQESERCKRIRIDSLQYRKLVEHIEASFDKNAHGEFRHIKTNANYGNNDAFYEAKGRYNLFQTCNTWANTTLKACGQKACLWTPFDKGIFRLYSR